MNMFRCSDSSFCARAGLLVLAATLGACVVGEDLQVGDDATSAGSAADAGTHGSGSTSVGSEAGTDASTTQRGDETSSGSSSSSSTTSGTTTSGASTSSSGTADASGSSASEDAESTVSSSESGGNVHACAEEPLPATACCWIDEDCGPDQRCYSAVCDIRSPGRCAVPPTDRCLDDRDCASNEHCVGGQLAPCNSLAPDGVGTCEPDCEYDSCHPERCDEEGESCCDPYPGDGPNYCNGGLECGREGCERPSPCGSIVCDVGEICCDRCGAECVSLLQGPACAEDDRPSDFVCDAALAAFSCETETCDSIGTQFCERSTSGDGTVTSRCHDLPNPCIGHPSCECLLRAGIINFDYLCSAGVDGAITVVPPPSP